MPPLRVRAALSVAFVLLLAVCSSAQGAAGPPVPGSLPTVSGNATVGQTLTCVAGSWTNADAQTTYSFGWQRNVATAIGSGSTYQLTSADAGQSITCSQTASNPQLVAGPLSATAISLPVIPAAAPAPLVPVSASLPSISGTASPRQTVDCGQGTWLNNPTSYAYAWQRDGSAISGQASSQYTIAAGDVNHAITCTVVASNSSGSSLPAISAVVVPVSAPIAPISASLPSISGTASPGQTVTCSQGTWLNNPTSYSFSWQRNGSNIAGQSSSQYTIASGDVNQAITCTVVASNPSGSSLPAISAVIVPVSAPVGLVPISVSAPSISGTGAPGQTVDCSQGSWLNSPTSYSYSWQRDGSAISGQTSNQYTIDSGDVNHLITCTVVASNAAGNSLPAVSAAVLVGAPSAGIVPMNTAPPLISGTASPGQTLTCSQGTWTNNPTSYAFSWQRDGTSLPGQTTNRYKIASGDVSHALTCTVVAANAVGSGLPATSAAVVPAGPAPAGAPVNQSAPKISGTAVDGQTLTCSSGSWSNAPTSYAYSWQRNASSLAGATAATYKLTSGDAGKLITCTVVAANASGKSLPAVSLPVTPTGGPKAVPPVLKTLSIGKVTVLVKHKQQSTTGATIRFTLDRAAGVLLYVQQRLPGKLSGTKCVAPGKVPAALARQWAKAQRSLAGADRAFRRIKHPTAADRKRLQTAQRQFAEAKQQYQRALGTPCARWVTVSLLVVKSANAGNNQLHFVARVGKRILSPGSYRVVGAAINLGGWSNPRTVSFGVVQKTVKGH